MMRYVLDSNVLLLLVVGLSDKRWIALHKRTANRFTVEHFDQLVRFLGRPMRLSTTSQILTEVSNLSRQGGQRYLRMQHVFARLIDESIEIHLPAKLITQDPAFFRYGLTDALMLKLDKKEYHILTVDGPLHGACLSVGLPCTNLTPFGFV